jgi:hypothetical protein
MKFKNGDAKHVALASALKHEFLRCADAFDDFAAAAKLSLVKTDDIRLVYRPTTRTAGSSISLPLGVEADDFAERSLGEGVSCQLDWIISHAELTPLPLAAVVAAIARALPPAPPASPAPPVPFAVLAAFVIWGSNRDGVSACPAPDARKAGDVQRYRMR